jgi:hypothetical protein
LSFKNVALFSQPLPYLFPRICVALRYDEDGLGRSPSKLYVRSTMPYLATILITLLLTIPAMSVDLVQYRGAAKDGGTLEYVFEGG